MFTDNIYINYNDFKYFTPFTPLILVLVYFIKHSIKSHINFIVKVP